MYVYGKKKRKKRNGARPSKVRNPNAGKSEEIFVLYVFCRASAKLLTWPYKEKPEKTVRNTTRFSVQKRSRSIDGWDHNIQYHGLP